MSELRFRSDIPVQLIAHMGDDHMIAAAARVSTDPGTSLKTAAGEGEVEGLINYLMKHRHGTPFEHGAMTFYVEAPIFVWREWHRHRIGFSYNEASARYSTLKPDFYVPHNSRPSFKVDEWKPGRPKFLTLEEEDERTSGSLGDAADYPHVKFAYLQQGLMNVYQSAYRAYEVGLENGIDPGLARDCLPVGIYSQCWVTCNPRSLMAFLSLRTHEPDAKFPSYPLYEIEVAARQCEALFAEHWPITYAAFVANGRVAP